MRYGESQQATASTSTHSFSGQAEPRLWFPQCTPPVHSPSPLRNQRGFRFLLQVLAEV